MNPSTSLTSVLIISPHVRRRESLQALVKAVIIPDDVTRAPSFSTGLLRMPRMTRFFIIYDGSALTEEQLKRDLHTIHRENPHAHIVLYLDQPKILNAELAGLVGWMLHADATAQALQQIFQKGTPNHETEHPQ